MRLAQIARKVQAKPVEIRSFIKKKFHIELDADPNIKLGVDHVNAILEEFQADEPGLLEEVEEEVVDNEEEIIDISIDTDVATLKEIARKVEGAEEDREVRSEETAEKEDAIEDKKIVSINYDEGDEEVPTEEASSFEEVEVDRAAELIAAEVDQLEGLKIVGKIDLELAESRDEDLPSADEIDVLDGEDTSRFTDLAEGATNKEKEAIFAELDAQMAGETSKVKEVNKEAAEILTNFGEDEEYSVHKNEKGLYRFSAEQRSNREKSLTAKSEKVRIKAQKDKKRRHYEQYIATKVKAKPKKIKSKPEKSAEKLKAQGKSKGLWRRFLGWLND